MGDGTTYIQNVLTPITYSYQYAGTYTISLSYYGMPSAAQPLLQVTIPVTVTIPTVVLETVAHGAAVQITNTTNAPMNVGHWPITTTEGIRALPDMTMIAPKMYITISARSLGLHSIQNPVMTTPDGTEVGK